MKISFTFDESGDRLQLIPENQADKAKISIFAGDGTRKMARIRGDSSGLVLEAIAEVVQGAEK